MPQGRVSDFHFIPRPLILRRLKNPNQTKTKKPPALFIRLALASLMTFGAHGFGRRGQKPPTRSGAACLHLQVGKGACSPVLVVCPFHYMVERVAVSSSSRFVSSEDAGALLGRVWGVMPCSAMGWCQRCSWLPSMCCFPKHVSPSANGLPGWERFGLLCLTWASQLKEDMFSCGSYTLSQLPFHTPATAVNHDGRWN